MKHISASLLLLGLMACSQSGTDKPAETATAPAAADAPVTATAAPGASTSAAIVHDNSVIVSGDKFKERTVISLPNGMGSTQLFPAMDGAPAYAMITINASNEEYTRTYGTTVTTAGNEPGTFELGPSQPARMMLNFNELDNAYYDSYHPGASGTLTVSKFDEKGKAVAGTYSGTFTNDTGGRITVHEGRFGTDKNIVVGP
ncbi:hypothetical protein [Hymenobacter koreensis]|uniref:Uncharacterized protein n=1 Tax=Hymenobacter koreensis TaxID=1084523 RepID=A0ABP8IUN5_9BACT